MGVCAIYPSSGQCLHPDGAAGAGTGSREQNCLQRCAQAEDLLQRVAELQGVVRRLCNIRETEKELDSWFQAQAAGNR